MVDQGDIIKVEGIKNLVLVLSKPLYNETGKIIGCPIVSKKQESSFQVEVPLEDKIFYVESDSLKQLDISARGYRVNGRIPLGRLMIVVDMINAIIEVI